MGRCKWVSRFRSLRAPAFDLPRGDGLETLKLHHVRDCTRFIVLEVRTEKSVMEPPINDTINPIPAGRPAMKYDMARAAESGTLPSRGSSNPQWNLSGGLMTGRRTKETQHHNEKWFHFHSNCKLQANSGLRSVAGRRHSCLSSESGFV